MATQITHYTGEMEATAVFLDDVERDAWERDGVRPEITTQTIIDNPTDIKPARVAAERLGISLEDAACYTKALARWAKAGFPVRPQAEVERIMSEHCRPCDDYIDGRCRECGCKVNKSRFPLVNKIKMATEGCKKEKWMPVGQSPAPSPQSPAPTPGLTRQQRIADARRHGLARVRAKRKNFRPPTKLELEAEARWQAKQPKAPPPGITGMTQPIAGKIDVVYTLSPQSKFNDSELRYSLRSLERFAENLGRVFVVGHKPDWLKSVIHIPHKEPHANKDADIINKILAACQSGVSERFIFASDDQCLLAPANLAEMPARYCGFPRCGSKWEKRLHATKDYLESNGVQECRHYDTHVFQPHSREEFQAAVAAAPYNVGNGVTINTLALNLSQTVPTMPIGRDKVTLYKGFTDPDQLRRKMEGKVHLGYNDRGATFAMWEVLESMFPHKSVYEDNSPDLFGSGIRSDTTGVLWHGDTRALALREELDAIIAATPETGTLLEIGTYHGLSASIVAAARPKATIYSVDPLDGRDNAKWQTNRLPNMRLLVGTVEDLLALQAGPFDAAFIDGDHRYEPCYKDLCACDRLLKPRGVMMAHDYEPVPGTHVAGKKGVRRAVDLFCERRHYRVEKTVGSVAVIERNGN